MRRLLKRLHGKNRAFTLVELMVVVAIIGILVATGIPQYKRFSQKAKKGEAKIQLGNIATAEAAFFAEYGGYGNNIVSMGAAADSAAYYTSGFATSTGCGSVAVMFWPSGGSSTTNPSSFASYSTMAGSTAAGSLSYGPLIGVAAAKAGGGSATVTNWACDSGSSVTNTPAFTATGAGVIGTSSTTTDNWKIDQTRLLTNSVDGVN